METAFSFRPATEDDILAIVEIEKRAIPTPWTDELFREELKKPFCHFLLLTDDETDSEIAGYIVFWMVFEDCHILNLAVDPKWRGLGFAQRLVRQAIAMAVQRGAKRVFLEVRKSNNPAIALYQKLGFFIDHVKKAFYSDGEAAYFMQFFLKDQ